MALIGNREIILLDEPTAGSWFVYFYWDYFSFLFQVWIPVNATIFAGALKMLSRTGFKFYHNFQLVLNSLTKIKNQNVIMHFKQFKDNPSDNSLYGGGWFVGRSNWNTRQWAHGGNLFSGIFTTYSTHNISLINVKIRGKSGVKFITNKLER